MAGLLGDFSVADIYSGADQIKRRLKGLLGDPREFLGQRSQDLQTMQDQDSALSYSRGLLSPQDPAHARMARNDPAFNQQQASAAEQRLLDIAMQGLTVYHGSPHKFDKFDASKIGTGEGAQAYGHGLYFAEKPAVATEYANNLARRADDATYWTTGEGSKVRLPEALDPSAKRELDILGQKMRERGNLDKKDMGRWRELHDKYRAYEDAVDTAKPKPNLYKVDLPDSAIEKMLDWDKPLSQQAENVRNAPAIKSLIEEDAAYLKRYPAMKERLGANAVANFMDKIGKSKEETAAILRQQGIPGIRYLDGGSRGAGSGTRNFVVFPGEEGLLNILERNGQGLLGK